MSKHNQSDLLASDDDELMTPKSVTEQDDGFDDFTGDEESGEGEEKGFLITNEDVDDDSEEDEDEEEDGEDEDEEEDESDEEDDFSALFEELDEEEEEEAGFF